MKTPRDPVVFLSYGSENRSLATQLAKNLFDHGVDVFFDAWEVRSGDSIREKLDHGLGRCTHFIVLLTPESIKKPWVRAEMDAAFVNKVKGQCVFIPLRYNLDTDLLPPLLRGLSSPALNDLDADTRRLVEDIRGENRRPDVNNHNNRLPIAPAGTGLSPAAEKIASLFVKKSKNGLRFDPSFTPTRLKEELLLSYEAIEDGANELIEKGLAFDDDTIAPRPHGFRKIMPEEQLFALFDGYFQPWSPREDAVKIAADLVNRNLIDKDIEPKALAKEYEWKPRRLNAAINYLILEDAIKVLHAIGTGPYCCAVIWATSKTRRFLREHEPRLSVREMIRANKDKVIEIAKRHKATNVRLFGSAQRGDNVSESDVDLLVSLAPDASLLDLEKLRIELESIFHRSFDIVDDRSLKREISARVLTEAEAL